jgi:hypothetical protein
MREMQRRDWLMFYEVVYWREFFLAINFSGIMIREKDPGHTHCITQNLYRSCKVYAIQ